MSFINTNINRLLESLVKSENSNMQVMNDFNQFQNQFIDDNGAFALTASMQADYARFDSTFGEMVSFQEMLKVAYNGFEDIKNNAVTIRDLIQQAKDEGYTPESIDAIQEEVNERLAAIKYIRENTDFNGINPFQTPFSLEIPNWQDMFGVNNTENDNKEGEQNESEITDLIASIKFDMNIGSEGDSKFGVGASATINIGYTEDGSLQIEVDATMDFDLSDLQKKGAGSDDALDLINRFIDFITGKQNGLNNANNMMDNFLAKGTASITGNGFSIDATNDINLDRDSNTLKGQIVQHAKITLDSTMANQCPGIAINLL